MTGFRKNKLTMKTHIAPSLCPGRTLGLPLGLFLSLSMTLQTAALDIPYQNKGTDGVLAPTGEQYVVDLSLAATGSWDAATPDNDDGIYDPEKWAVVFKFSSINIPAGTTVTFKNHPSRAPVVWLVEGDVTIHGRVNLDGAPGDLDVQRIVLSEPGPGGFRGGDYAISGVGPVSGFGPGGSFGNPGAGGTAFGFSGAQGPSYGTYGKRGIGGANVNIPPYGNSRIMPLIGGSGNGSDGNAPTAGGGAGGGAILVASSGNIDLGTDGRIHANGNGRNVGAGSPGTGGAVRLICHRLLGRGLVQAEGRFYSGHGRIRLETLETSGSVVAQPFTVVVPPDNPVRLWPDDNSPSVRLVSVGGIDAPPDPRAEIAFGLVQGSRPSDFVLSDSATTNRVTIETLNLATNAIVTLRVVSIPAGRDIRIRADLSEVDSENPSRMLWTKVVETPPGWHVFQVVAVSP